MLPKSGEIYLLQQFAIFIIFDYNYNSNMLF